MTPFLASGKGAEIDLNTEVVGRICRPSRKSIRRQDWHQLGSIARTQLLQRRRSSSVALAPLADSADGFDRTRRKRRGGQAETN